MEYSLSILGGSLSIQLRLAAGKLISAYRAPILAPVCNRCVVGSCIRVCSSLPPQQENTFTDWKFCRLTPGLRSRVRLSEPSLFPMPVEHGPLSPDWDWEPLLIWTATWLILPVVICLSQRLSHACLSTSLTKVKPRMAH